MAASQRFIVSKLTVESVSGPTCYADEGGFSYDAGEVATDEEEVSGALARFAEQGLPVTLQCGRLVVVGRLKDASTPGMQTKFRVDVLDVQFAVQTLPDK
jgi:hypothetical protein